MCKLIGFVAALSLGVVAAAQAQTELDRVEGALLKVQGASGPEIEACFARAVALTHQQGAKSLELRAASSLAGLWRDQGRHAEARALLAPVYDWFTEGFDTADLEDAKALLDEFG